MSRKLAVVLVAVMLASTLAFADTILSGTAGSGWSASGWTPLNTNAQPSQWPNNGSPTSGAFWDNASFDGSGGMNIGFCLTGTGACTGASGIASPPGALAFWKGVAGGVSGAADTNVFFQSNGSSSSVLQAEIAGNKNINVFGWFATDSTGSFAGPLNVIFSGPDSKGATATFTPTQYYGFYLQTVIDGNTLTYYSLANVAGNSDLGFQHLAVFQGSNGGFWVGGEDQPNTHTDFDYNDLVVSVTPVPEPTTLVMLGSGLLGLAGAVRRKLRA